MKLNAFFFSLGYLYTVVFDLFPKGIKSSILVQIGGHLRYLFFGDVEYCFVSVYYSLAVSLAF